MIPSLKKDMDSVIKIRESKDINDFYGINECWNEIIELLSDNINETIAYLNNCSEKEVYYISEVFEDIAERTKRKEFIECLRLLDKKYPELKLKQDIDIAEDYVM